jgi:LysM repeat protein/lipoprotein-anchoring transpeptidase ErfK/SrfK
VRVLTLPAYSAELNPVKKLWDQIKNVLCHRAFGSIAQLRAILAAWRASFWSDAQRAFDSNTSKEWLLKDISVVMVSAILRILLVLAGLFLVRLHAQNVQPGLEAAVKWKWWVLPSEEKDWGFPVTEPIQAPAASPSNGPTLEKKIPSAQAGISIAPGPYEVKRGDALAIIARKSGVPVGQLKRFNALAKDTIRVGQILKIPTPAESIALAPPIPAAAKPAQPAPPVPKKRKKSPVPAPEEPEIDYVAEATLIQAFLDRENFSNGSIDGNDSGALQTLSALYRSSHQDLQTPEALRAKAVAVVGEPFAIYKLKRSDFRFISPPKAISTPVVSQSKKATAKNAPVPKAPSRPPVTYEELLAAKYSAYRTPWEFVAERFHCDEAFLRSLNPNIKNAPTAEMTLKVPNVMPFKIEKCFESPLRPKADPEQPITAAIVDLTRLEIRQGGQLIATMPMSRARPGLRGRGSWTILGAIPGPRFATRQESTSIPKATPELVATVSSTEPAPPATPLAADQILAAGPKNPVGVFWIDLAKANSTTPLPYGLHGTGIPNRMKTQESIGGLRLTNWDIARAVRMLPEGTPLAWK